MKSFLKNLFCETGVPKSIDKVIWKDLAIIFPIV